MSKLEAKAKIRESLKRLIKAANEREKERVNVRREDLELLLALCAAKEKAGGHVEIVPMKAK